MVKRKILSDLTKAIKDAGFEVSDLVCTSPKNPSFGEYTTNIALQLSKSSDQNNKQTPIEIANQILEKLGQPGYLKKAEVAGNGFINFFLSEQVLLDELNQEVRLDLLSQTKILIEYGHTNPLKEVHIGHLRTFILGESLSRIFESLGNEVFRANYQGDIGLHIAKAIWGIQQVGFPKTELPLDEKAKFLGQCYAKGNSEYDASSDVKQEIDEINLKLYQKDPSLHDLYQVARDWSLAYFEPIYKLLGINYNRCFFESEVFERGKDLVEQNIGNVFERNDGAVIFPGEKYGLHSRVFISSAGNPTYEAKEVGLAELEYQTFAYDQSIHVVASEQEGYFQVVIKAIEMIMPNLKGKKEHLSYGVVDLKEGKMSSRTGNVVTIDRIYQIISARIKDIIKHNNLVVDERVIQQVAVGAIKFAYLKYSPRPNMVFDIDESVSLDGDSGPYVQYTYARISSILQKKKLISSDSLNIYSDIETEEKMILRQLIYFQETVEQAAFTKHPNLITTYLVDLARLYNFFYQKHRVIGSDKEEFRLLLSKRVAETISIGLGLLGIESPQKM